MSSVSGDDYPTLDYDQVKVLKDDPSYILIDVRQPQELKDDGFIPGAINIPRKFFFYNKRFSSKATFFYDSSRYLGKRTQ